jgi:hypothetical protein
VVRPAEGAVRIWLTPVGIVVMLADGGEVWEGWRGDFDS